MSLQGNTPAKMMSCWLISEYPEISIELMANYLGSKTRKHTSTFPSFWYWHNLLHATLNNSALVLSLQERTSELAQYTADES